MIFSLQSQCQTVALDDYEYRYISMIHASRIVLFRKQHSQFTCIMQNGLLLFQYFQVDRNNWYIERLCKVIPIIAATFKTPPMNVQLPDIASMQLWADCCQPSECQMTKRSVKRGNPEFISLLISKSTWWCPARRAQSLRLYS